MNEIKLFVVIKKMMIKNNNGYFSFVFAYVGFTVLSFP